MGPLTQSTSVLSKAQTLLKDALVKLSKLDSDSYLLVISKCPILCLNSVDASVQHTGDDSALVLHLHNFNVLVDHVLQLQNGDTDSDAPKMRKTRFARAFQVPLKVPFTGTRRKKAAVAKLVDSAHVLQVILQTNKQHQGTHRGSTDDSPSHRETSQACDEPTGTAQQLTVTTSTSSTDKAGTTLGISNLERSVFPDTKLDDLTTHDTALWQSSDAKCHRPAGLMGTPCGGDSRTQCGGKSLVNAQWQIPQQQGLQQSGAESVLASTDTSCSSHTAAHQLRATTPPVPRLRLGGLPARTNSAGLGATCSPAASPLSADSKATSMRKPTADVACGYGAHLSRPGSDSLHSLSFRDVTSSRYMAVDAGNSLGEHLLSRADSVMITPIKNPHPCRSLESGARPGRKHICPSRLGSVVTPCSSITSHHAGTFGDSFSANMSYSSPAAINGALAHTFQYAPSTPATSLLSQEYVPAHCQQVAPGTDPSPEAPRADAAQLWVLVTGKPASSDVSLPCYDFVTSLFMYCMSRPPCDIERTLVTRILNPFQYKEVNFSELAEFMTYTGPYTVSNDDSDLAYNSESDNMLCRFLNDVISPVLRVCEPWFRPQLNNDDLVTLQKATHGQYLVAASTFLGYFELAFVRARRNYLDMEEDLLTPRCGEVVVMYLQILPTTRIRIVPTKLVWLPSEVLESTYACLRHVIHTLVLANLLHSPAVPQSDSEVQSPCSLASSQRSDGRPDNTSDPISGHLDQTSSHGPIPFSGMRQMANVNNDSHAYQFSPQPRPGCQLLEEDLALEQTTAQQQGPKPACFSVLPGSVAQNLSYHTDSVVHERNWVVNAWDPVGAPAPSAQVTPESSPCKSQRSLLSPIPPSASCNVSPRQGRCTPPTSRSDRRLDAMLQQKLSDSLQETLLSENLSSKDQCSESLPSCLGFVTNATFLHVDSPAHMWPGPQETSGLEEQLKPVSGPGGFHVLPLKALLGATPPSTGQHQPLQFCKAEFSFSANMDAAASPSRNGAAEDVVLETGGETPQVSPPRITRGPGIAFSLPAMQLPLETPQYNSSLTEVTMDTALTNFNASAEVLATVNGFFELRTPENVQQEMGMHGSDSGNGCGPAVLSECVTPGILSDDDKTCLSPLPSDLLYSTGPQHQLRNFVLNNGSDSGDDAHESLKATSNQGDDCDCRSSSTDSGDEEDVCHVDDCKFELSAPGIKMPSLSFLMANTKMHCLAPRILQPSCTEMRDGTARPHGGCAVESKGLLWNEMAQEDCKLGEGQLLPQDDPERMQGQGMPDFSGVTWFNPVFVHG